MKKRIIKIIKFISLAAVLGAGYAGIYMYTGFGIPCVFYVITGLKCPGCGITRMFVSLLSLDPGQAFLSNRVLFCMLPLFALFGAYRMILYIRTGKTRLSGWENAGCYLVIAILVIWGVVRNL